MIIKMEDDLSKLENVLIQNFEDFQGNLKKFMENNNKLINVYIENVEATIEPRNDQKMLLQTYIHYISGLFGMLMNTTEFIKNMMLKAQTTKNTLQKAANTDTKTDNDTESIGIPFSASEITITGYEPDFSYDELNGDTYSKPSLPCGTIDISKFEPGCVIRNAIVTSVQLDELSFHIGIRNSNDSDILLKLFNAVNRKSYDYAPLSGVIFGMKVDGGIVRAMRCLPIDSGKVFLLDFGDIVQIEKNLENILLLSKEEQEIPAQAILCKLSYPESESESSYESKSEIVKKLDQLKFDLCEGIGFRVTRNDGHTLYLEVIQELNSENNNHSKPDKKTTSPTANSDEEVCNNTNYNQLWIDELEMLYEEPTSTSNALIAVTGYVPKDDQQICHFYDPKTGGCFKGSHCRKKHVPLREDYITKDVVPANVYAEHRVITTAPIQYNPKEILKIKVIHIESLQYFYGFVLKDSERVEPVVFTDIDIRPSDYLKKLPYTYDIVLAKFSNDGKWYRVQVEDVNEYNKTVKAFYMDYGNRETVSIKNLARCTEHVAKIPPQVQKFRLADISINYDSEDTENQLRGMRMLCDMILDNELKIKVVSHYEDLIVRFIDEPFSEIPLLLEELCCIKLVNLLPI